MGKTRLRSRPIRENAMPISVRLDRVDLTLKCNHLNNLLIKKRRYFMTASTFKCDACNGELRLTYSDKVALFAKHAHLA
jgi:hypothetical protein